MRKKDNDSTAYLANRLSGVPEITLIGEAVTMGSLAAFIEKKYQKPVRVICPLETHENLLATNDCTANGEEEMEKLLRDADIIVADPLYRPICPKQSQFYELPHIAFSGRIFLKDIKRKYPGNDISEPRENNVTWSSSSGMGSRGRNRGNCRINTKIY